MLLNKSRKIALLGLLLAINQIFIILAAVLDISSLSFLAVAAMVIGIAILETGLRDGIIFFVASCLLGLILCPQPLYIVSYAVMGVYVLLKECLERKLKGKKPLWQIWLWKLLGFNIYFVPMLLFFPQILLEAGEGKRVLIVIWLMAQVAVILCDMVYDRILILYQKWIRKVKNSGGASL